MSAPLSLRERFQHESAKRKVSPTQSSSAEKRSLSSLSSDVSTGSLRKRLRRRILQRSRRSSSSKGKTKASSRKPALARIKTLFEKAEKGNDYIVHRLPIKVWSIIANFLYPEENIKLLSLTSDDWVRFTKGERFFFYPLHDGEEEEGLILPSWYNPSNLVLRSETWGQCTHEQKGVLFTKMKNVTKLIIDNKSLSNAIIDLGAFLQINSKTLEVLYIKDFSKSILQSESFLSLDPISPEESLLLERDIALTLPKLKTLTVEGSYAFQWISLLRRFELPAVKQFNLKLPPVHPRHCLSQKPETPLLSGTSLFLGGTQESLLDRHRSEIAFLTSRLESLETFSMSFLTIGTASRQVALACFSWLGSPSMPKGLKCIELRDPRPFELLRVLNSRLKSILLNDGGSLEDMEGKHQLDETEGSTPMKLPPVLDLPIFYRHNFQASKENDASTSEEAEGVELSENLLQERLRHARRRASRLLWKRFESLEVLKLISNVSQELAPSISLFHQLLPDVAIDVPSLIVRLDNPLAAVLLPVLAPLIEHLTLSFAPSALLTSKRMPRHQLLSLRHRDPLAGPLEMPVIEKSEDSEILLQRFATTTFLSETYSEVIDQIPSMSFPQVRYLTLAALRPKFLDHLKILLKKLSFGVQPSDQIASTLPPSLARQLTVKLRRDRRKLKRTRRQHLLEKSKTTSSSKYPLDVELLFRPSSSMVYFESITETEVLNKLLELISLLNPISVTTVPAIHPTLFSNFKFDAKGLFKLELTPICCPTPPFIWSAMKLFKLRSSSSVQRATVEQIELGSIREIKWLHTARTSAPTAFLNVSTITILASAETASATAYAFDNIQIANQHGIRATKALLQASFAYLSLCETVEHFRDSLRELSYQLFLPLEAARYPAQKFRAVLSPLLEALKRSLARREGCQRLFDTSIELAVKTGVEEQLEEYDDTVEPLQMKKRIASKQKASSGFVTQPSHTFLTALEALGRRASLFESQKSIKRAATFVQDKDYDLVELQTDLREGRPSYCGAQLRLASGKKDQYDSDFALDSSEWYKKYVFNEQNELDTYLEELRSARCEFDDKVTDLLPDTCAGLRDSLTISPESPVGGSILIRFKRK